MPDKDEHPINQKKSQLVQLIRYIIYVWGNPIEGKFITKGNS
jgi:hypothetical protein